MRDSVKSKAAIILMVVLAGAGLPASAQTSLTMSDPNVIGRVIGNKAEIERCIILATPSSLAAAREGLSQSNVISEDDRLAMMEIIRGLSMLLYPSITGSSAAGSGFFVDTALKNINPVYSICLSQLVEAFQGRIFAAPKGSEGSFFTQILPALAIFTTTDRGIARTALGYAQRFESSGGMASVIPGLVKAKAARLDGNLADAYYLYKTVLDSWSELWPARFALGTLSLEMGMPVLALSYLSPLVEAGMDGKALMAAYAVALYRNGRLADAEPHVLKSLKSDPDSPELLAIAAHILIDRNNFTAAQPYLESLGRLGVQDRLYLYLKALHSKGQNRGEEALKWARKAQQVYPDDPEIKALLAGILFAGPEAGHKEATALCIEAKKGFEEDRAAVAEARQLPSSPLAAAMREEAERESNRVLLLEAYNHQDWYAAAGMLDTDSDIGLDKAIVATILRKSGKSREALDFSSDWYNANPQSELAAEAYLRSLAAASSGIGVASASSSVVSDGGMGLFGLLGGSLTGNAASASGTGQPSIVGLVLQLLSGSWSANMRSYLFYLSGTLQTNPDAAIDSYRLALLERADNVEAIAALAKAYARKNDPQKALSFIRQAKAIGINDADLATELATMEATLIQG